MKISILLRVILLIHSQASNIFSFQLLKTQKIPQANIILILESVFVKTIIIK